VGEQKPQVPAGTIRIKKNTSATPATSEPSAQPAGPEPEHGQQAPLDAMYEGIVIVDASGWITDANRRALDLLGYSRKDILEMTLPQVFSGIGRTVMQKIREHLQDGRYTVLDVTCIRKDGSRFLFETAVGRFVDASGDRLLFSLRSIEKRRRARDKMRLQQVTAEQNGTAILVTDTDGTISYANPAAAELWQVTSPDALVRRPVNELFMEPDALKSLRETVSAGRTWVGQLEGRPGKGDAVPLLIAANGCRDGQDPSGGWILSCLRTGNGELLARRERVSASSVVGNLVETALRIVSTADVVRLVAETGQTGLLTVSGSAGRCLATLGFRDGAAIRAECGGITGEDAFCRAVRLDGHLDFRRDVEAQPDPSIRRSTMALLLHAVMCADETDTATGASETPPAGSVLRVKKE